MKLKALAALVFAAFAALPGAASHDDDGVFMTTLITTPLVIEGLTNDDDGNLYAPGRNPPSGPCPVWRVNLQDPVLTIVGTIPRGDPVCSPSGLALGPDGRMYVSVGSNVYAFTPNASSPPTAEVFASGVPGTNGLAFDRDGNLWTGDGTTGVGRVWKITPAGAVTEMFRIQPMVNSVGVGRENRTLPPGTAQPLVANGLAFDRRGNLLVADTARGAIWRVRIGDDGSIDSPMNCDTTFTANTLCLTNILVQHPLLDGADGIALDVAGNIWVSANERNAIVFVRPTGQVIEVFRNEPDPVTKLRNGGPAESPASPVLAGHRFCTSNSDGNRRDNSPPSAGEIAPGTAAQGKITCLSPRVAVRGVSLPVR